MKKLLKYGLTVFVTCVAFLSLSACGSNDTAKKAFASDYLALTKTKDNSQEISLDLTKIKATGSGAAAINQFAGSKATIKASMDTANKIASLSATIAASGKNYKIDLLMSESGLYIASDDIKALYNDSDINSLLTGSADATTKQAYDALISSLTAPYLLIDAKTLNQGLSSSDETWEDTVDEMFVASKSTISESDVAKALKDAPVSAFTQKGDKTAFKAPLGSSYFLNFIKVLASANANLTASQTNKMMRSLKDSDAQADLKKITAEMSLNKKTHEAAVNIAGKISEKSKDSLDFQMKMNSKSSKLEEEIQLPAADQAQTLEEVQNAAISVLFAGQVS
ncbi:hypothetical protein OfM2_13570 [Lactovum odontotermitis]